MRATRRINRLSRHRSGLPKMNLTSLMDVFTILVFFLLVNSGSAELLDAPRQMILPESLAETKPRETVVIYINTEEVLVQGEPVVSIAELLAAPDEDVIPIMARLSELQRRVIGFSTQAVADSQEVTILADRSVPFSVVKQIMSTCTAQGYGRISLAVIQKDAAGTAI
jgi:biopolymer transport protein ExbD